MLGFAILFSFLRLGHCNEVGDDRSEANSSTNLVHAAMYYSPEH